jgi:hypothetical protein
MAGMERSQMTQSSARAEGRVKPSRDDVWPALPLADWKETCSTLHMWMQVVGKVRLALAPMLNHWWQATLYVTPRGLTTSAVPYGDRHCQIDFDFIDHRLLIVTSEGGTRSLELAPRSVADFYHEAMAALHSLDIRPRLWPVPVEVPDPIPFADDHDHASYDPEYANRHWRILRQAHRVLSEFRGRFTGKASPVHFYWGSFDLAASRFSGRRAPRHETIPVMPDSVTMPAYSHEVCSVGFWPGGYGFEDPAFYSYIYPIPVGYAEARVQPEGAFFSEMLAEFVLPYDTVRTAEDPDETLLTFAQSTYEAAADLAGWDREALEDRAALEWTPESSS